MRLNIQILQKDLVNISMITIVIILFDQFITDLNDKNSPAMLTVGGIRHILIFQIILFAVTLSISKLLKKYAWLS